MITCIYEYITYDYNKTGFNKLHLMYLKVIQANPDMCMKTRKN